MKRCRTSLYVGLWVVFSFYDAWSQITEIDLMQYDFERAFDIPADTLSKASAITYNWDTGHLFVLGDGGDKVVELAAAGQVISTMNLIGLSGAEALTYIGDGRLVLGDERLQTVYWLDYAPGATVSRTELPAVSLDSDVSNVGLEGLSFDLQTGLYYTVKERAPQAVSVAFVDFETGTGGFLDTLFPPPDLGVADLSGIQVVLPERLLLVSQESSRLLAADLSGVITSQLDLSLLSSTIKGVTLDSTGAIYLLDETPRVYVLQQFPEGGELP